MPIHISEENGQLRISSINTTEDFEILSRTPDAARWKDRDRIVRPSGANIKYLSERYSDDVWNGARRIKEDYDRLQQEAEHTKEAKFVSLEDDTGYEFKRQPMKHQEQAFLLSRDKEAFALFMEQGTGKTKVTIDTAAYLYKKGEIDTLIVVAWPNGVHRNWTDVEIPKDVPDWCPYVCEAWKSGASKKKLDSIQKVFETRDKLRIMAFNVEAFSSEKAKQVMLDFVQSGNCLVVIDQSASIKNPQAKRTKFLIDKVSQHAKYRRILDGLPIAEGASELYSQFKFLDPNIIGHSTWTSFRGEFCNLGYFNEVVSYRNLDKLQEKIEGHSYRVRANECLDLPPRVYLQHRFELGSDERRIYDELKKQSLAFFQAEGEEYIEAELAITKAMRLQQIASGWWPEQENFKPIGNSNRLNALLNLIEMIGDDKALIYSRFVADLEEIEKALGDKAVSYRGGVSDEERDLAKKRFMEDPSVLYFVGQPNTAGIGHTLTAAKNVIFYANGFSLRLREECEKRVHRKGIEETLNDGQSLRIWDLVANDTVDGGILDSLRGKKELSAEILHDPEEFFLVNAA